MSYAIYIKHRKTNETVRLREKHNITGGTYCVGGNEYAEFNITYNYAKWFYKVWPEPKSKEDKDDSTPFGQMFGSSDGGIRSLYEKPIDDVIKELERACRELHGKPCDDYWRPTQGNARAALFKLKMLCEIARYENPDDDLTIVGD